MVDHDETLNGVEGPTGLSALIGNESDMEEDKATLEETAKTPASARQMARSATCLRKPPDIEIGNVTAFLLGDVDSYQSLEAVESVNSNNQSDARTPLMTVITALLQKQGGSMLISDIAAEVDEYWNRPFPASPYTREEFLYVLMEKADNIRLS
ncbi:MAG: hypothetical protein V2B18_23085 [Pseudomonadota bacterium]